MLYNVIKNTVISILQRFFGMCYFLISLSIIWGSMANYYYFTQQDLHFIGALITAIVLFILGFTLKLLDLYLKKRAANNNTLNNIMNSVISLFSPIVIKSFINNIIRKKSTKVAAVSALLLASMCYFIFKRKSIISQIESNLIK